MKHPEIMGNRKAVFSKGLVLQLTAAGHKAEAAKAALKYGVKL
ncbi:MAG: hypothetical protein U0103_07570 [Candidatus Obscuribacterales bacterium]